MNSLAPDEARPRQRRAAPPRIPAAPRKPSAEARRLIFRYQGSQKAMLLIGIAFTLFGAPFVAVFGWGTPVDVAISVSGTYVEGRGLGAELNRSVTINEEHPTRVRFSYEVDGRPYTGEVNTFEPHIIAAGSTGGPFTLEVARAEPTWARPEGTSFATFGYLGLLPLLFPLLGVSMWVRAVRGNRREIAAFTHGEPAQGLIVFSGLDHSTEINGRHPRLLKWDFEVHAQRYSGSLSGFKLGALETLSEGDEVTVLYHPEDPRVNTLYID